MLKEASIFFHYEPGTTHRRQEQGQQRGESKARFRRSLYNLVTKLVDNIDWHANFTTVLPFDIGLDSRNVSAGKQ